jgi:hypothetical protein
MLRVFVTRYGRGIAATPLKMISAQVAAEKSWPGRRPVSLLPILADFKVRSLGGSAVNEFRSEQLKMAWSQVPSPPGNGLYSSKRRYPRMRVDRPVIAILNWPDTPVMTVPGRCRVLGEGGLGASMAQQFRLGEVVYLEISSGVRVYAAVRSQSGFQHGFEFVLLRDTQRESLKRLWRASG